MVDVTYLNGGHSASTRSLENKRNVPRLQASKVVMRATSMLHRRWKSIKQRRGREGGREGRESRYKSETGKRIDRREREEEVAR